MGCVTQIRFCMIPTKIATLLNNCSAETFWRQFALKLLAINRMYLVHLILCLSCIYMYSAVNKSIWNYFCTGERPREFSIFVYNPVIPSWATYNSGEEILCYSHEGRSPDILNVSCNRKNKGRYLEIRKISKPFGLNDTLTLCEVQVFTSTKLSGKCLTLNM